MNKLETILEDVRRHLMWQAASGGEVILREAAAKAPAEPTARPAPLAARVPSAQAPAATAPAPRASAPSKRARSIFDLPKVKPVPGPSAKRSTRSAPSWATASGASSATAARRSSSASATRARELVFVGEGPGADEDAQGEPFVGKAGQLLTKMIEAMGFARDDVYICNVVKCRPPGNRNPEPDEIAACEPFLKAQLARFGPKVIVALGKFAAQTLLRDDDADHPAARPVARVRGRAADADVPPRVSAAEPGREEARVGGPAAGDEAVRRLGREGRRRRMKGRSRSHESPRRRSREIRSAIRRRDRSPVYLPPGLRAGERALPGRLFPARLHRQRRTAG